MKALVCAAGLGKRMRPLTDSTPKPLLSVLGKPLIHYTFEAMPESVDSVVVVVGYCKEQIMSFLGNSFLGKPVTYVVQEELRGTGDALELSRSALGDGPFIKFLGDDIYLKADVERLLEHRYSMLVGEVDDPRQFGVVECAADGHVVGFEEKPEHPKAHLVSAGVMLLDERVFAYKALPHPKTGERYAVDMVMGLAHEYPVFAVQATRWIPIGYPEDLTKAEAILSSHLV